MKHSKIIHLLASAYLTITLGSSSVVYADDTEIYLTASTDTALANLLFNLDTSGSMGEPVDENNNGVIDTGERTRIEVLKEAMGVVLDSLPNINVGLMRYHYYGGPILYPVARLDEDACVIEGNCAPSGAGTGIQTVTTLLASGDDDAEQEGVAVTLDRSALDFGQRAAGTCSTNSASVRVSTGTDDAESLVAVGAFTSGSTDLEIPRDGGQPQVVGMRFQGVPIPAGATVTDARLVFQIDSTSRSGYSAPIDIIITGENMTGTRVTFSSANQPKDRLVMNPTTATVNWETGEFPAKNEFLTTDNIAAILSELVTDPAWPALGGADMVLLLNKDPGAPGSGSREVESFNGEPPNAPLLTFTYSTCSGTAAEMRMGLRFANVSIPQGATITSARIDLVATAPGVGDPNVEIAMEDTDDAAPFTTASPFSGRSFTGGSAQAEDWDTGSSPVLGNPWVVDTTYSTPDLTDQVQTVVNRGGWCGGNAMMFMLERGTPNGDDVLRTAYSSEGDSTKAPQLSITYDADTAQSGATGCTRTTIVSLINAGTNDAEEHSDGTMDLASSDLEMVEDSGDTQQLGLRFTDIPVASGTTITSAKLVFTVDEIDSGAATVTFNGQLSDDADPFGTAINDISDVVTRPRTSASLTWTPPAFATVGQIIEVTGLETVIQEISISLDGLQVTHSHS